MGEIAAVMTKITITALTLFLPHLFRLKKEKTESFCAGFCIAQGTGELCTHCPWMYSVVFGETTGFIMFAVTIIGSLVLFALLTNERSVFLHVLVYIFFSSAGYAYSEGEKSIIELTAHGFREGCAGVGNSEKRKPLIMLLCAVAGSIVGGFAETLPAAFSAISCCGLIVKGMRGINGEKTCVAGIAAACLLAYI